MIIAHFFSTNINQWNTRALATDIYTVSHNISILFIRESIDKIICNARSNITIEIDNDVKVSYTKTRYIEIPKKLPNTLA